MNEYSSQINMQGVPARCAREEELKPAQSEQRKVIIAGNRYGIKPPTTQNSVLPAKKRVLAHASQEGAEQTQGGKAVQREMNKHDRQGLQVSGRNLNSNINTRSEYTTGEKTRGSKHRQMSHREHHGGLKSCSALMSTRVLL